MEIRHRPDLPADHRVQGREHRPARWTSCRSGHGPSITRRGAENTQPRRRLGMSERRVSSRRRESRCVILDPPPAPRGTRARSSSVGRARWARSGAGARATHQPSLRCAGKEPASRCSAGGCPGRSPLAGGSPLRQRRASAYRTRSASWRRSCRKLAHTHPALAVPRHHRAGRRQESRIAAAAERSLAWRDATHCSRSDRRAPMSGWTRGASSPLRRQPKWLRYWAGCWCQCGFRAADPIESGSPRTRSLRAARPGRRLPLTRWRRVSRAPLRRRTHTVHRHGAIGPPRLVRCQRPTGAWS